MTLAPGFEYTQHNEGPRLHISREGWRDQHGHWTLCNMLWTRDKLVSIGVWNEHNLPVCRSCERTYEWLRVGRDDASLHDQSC